MAIFTILLLLLSSLLPSIGASRTSALDVERKNDINSVYQKLEEAYNNNGEYPTEDQLATDYEIELPGLDPEALIDPDGLSIQEGDYIYSPTECGATGCDAYTLSATLSDGTLYTKESLN